FRAYVADSLKDKLIKSWQVEPATAYKSTGDADPKKRFDGKPQLKVAVEDPAGVLNEDVTKKALARMPLYQIQDGKRTSLDSSKVVRDVDVTLLGTSQTGETKQFEILWSSKLASDASEVEKDPAGLVADIGSYLRGSAFK